MTQISKYKMDSDVSEKVSQVFLETIVKIKNKSLAKLVLSQLLSPTEMIMLSKRLAIVYLLEKEYPQREISRVLKVSLTTVVKMNTLTQDELGIHKIITSILADEEIKTFFAKLDKTLTKLIVPKIGRRHKLHLE